MCTTLTYTFPAYCYLSQHAMYDLSNTPNPHHDLGEFVDELSVDKLSIY